MKTTPVRTRIEKDLLDAGARLRRLGAIDTSPRADALDESQSTTTREIGWTTRELLVERVNRLSAALDRLRGDAYGVCIECDEPLSPARLLAMPEVGTCVDCQSGFERLDRRAGRSREELFALVGPD